MHMKIEYQGRLIDCYGKLREDSNFEVICEDMDDDGIWCDGNPDDPDYIFYSWTQVVKVLSQHFDSDIQEISAV